jgi:hypothetical protein
VESLSLHERRDRDGRFLCTYGPSSFLQSEPGKTVLYTCSRARVCVCVCVCVCDVDRLLDNTNRYSVKAQIHRSCASFLL